LSTFKKPIAGEPANLILGETFQSALVDVVNAYQRGELTRKETGFRKDHVVMVKNASAANIKSGEMLAIEQDVTPPAYADTVQSFVQNPFVIGNAVTWHDNIGYVAVATQPILQDMVGPCAFRPWGQVQADIGGAGDWLMVSPTDPKQFMRSTGGIARVIAYDATTGKCVADFLEQQPLWRFELLADVENLLGLANLIDLGGNVYATATIRFTNSTKVAGDAGFCLHTGNHFDAIESAATIASAPTPRFRFRLKTDFDDTGVATAYVLDVFGNVTNPDGSPVALGDVLTVHDPRKCFAHAVGADSLTAIQTAGEPFFAAGGSIGYAIKTNQLKADPSDPDDDQYPRWEVEQCTQTVNRMLVEIDRGATGDKPTGVLGEPTITVKVVPNEAVASHWPYVDYPPELQPPAEEGGEWYIECKNPERFSAGDGWAIIERVHDGCRAEDASNVDTPYTSNGLGNVSWNIVGVQNPIARWVCASWVQSGEDGEWEIPEGEPTTVFEGQNPVVVNYFENYDQFSLVVKTANCLNVDCLKHGSNGIGFWDPNVQEYKIVSTDSALYGQASKLEVVGQFDPDGTITDPLIRFGDPSVGEEPCDLRYVKSEPVRVFGGNDSCPTIKNEIVVPSNMIAVDVVSNVVRNGDDLCFTYDTLYVCRTDTGVSDDCLNVCCDDVGCCEYPPGTYTPNVTQANCNGTWTPGPCPPPSECFDCSECPENQIQFSAFALSWDGVPEAGNPNNFWDGRALLGTAAFTNGQGCCATLTVTLQTDDPQIPNQVVTADVCVTAASGTCPSSTWEITLAWSTPTFANVTLPTTMCGGFNTTCAGDYGLSGGAGIDPSLPNQVAGFWGEGSLTVVDCDT
jgi:hypothetical protein